jgi:hypothetical protein
LRRASLKPIAIACFRLRTFLPELLRSVPFFLRCIADLTRRFAAVPYLAMPLVPARAVRGTKLGRNIGVHRLHRVCTASLNRQHALISILAIFAMTGVARLDVSGNVALAMTISPHLSFAPADLRVRLDVTPNARNRSLLVVAESDEFYRSSELPLDAEDAPRSITIQFRGLPPGEYAVSSEAKDADGGRCAFVHQEITVLAGSAIR